AEQVATLFRRVRRRAPKDVARRVRLTLERVFSVVSTADGNIHQRLNLAKRLEALEFELQGRDAGVVQFYCNGRLAIIRLYNPIRIRETVNHASCLEHVRRYEERVDRAQRRLHWFYERAGLTVEPPPPLKPWELPYAAFEEVHELIWGKIRRM
ncbi:MAG: hypothetical protein QF464_07465, partial [Myxococcota bacterium]|nr:hypothetical protein [Myxococcota bacterium]